MTDRVMLAYGLLLMLVGSIGAGVILTIARNREERRMRLGGNYDRKRPWWARAGR